MTDKFFDEFTTLLESVAIFQSEVIISGDFNIHVDDTNDRHGRRLLDILDSFDMVQNISVPTHKGGHTLDLVITRRNSPPMGFRVDPPVYSDHGLTLCAFPPVNIAVRRRSKDVRFWKHLNRDAFRQSLLNSQLCDSADALSTLSPAALFDLYDGTLRRIVDEHLPVENISVKDRPLTPWYDNDCRNAKRKVRMCERRYRRTRSEIDCMAWIRQMERKRNLLEQKEERYWNSKITLNAGNSKKLWSVLNDLQRKDRATTPSTSDISAETLSGFFQDKVRAVRDDTSTADAPTFTNLTDASFTSFQPCSMEEVRKLLIRSPPKSCSLDPLPTSILREFLDELLPFICTMCNVSLQHGLLPESQKEAIVTPILKKHDLDPDDVKSYRPISNLTFISKVIERIVASQLTGYLQTNKLLPDHQSAYRQGHSTETALLKIFSDILDAADSAQVTLLGLLDMSAAFDTVDHDILLTRLHKSYGVGGTALAWISSFIQGRQQSVIFNGHQSARIQLKYGVPQGSVLGPLLFILYTSDVISIAASLGVGAHSYADDSQLYLHCLAVDQRSAALRLAECIERVEGWMKSNRLKLNSDKTQFMWLGSRQQLAKIDTKTITIGEHSIESSTSAKNLGVTFDSELGMDLHVNNITRSCFYQLRQLRSIRRSLSTDAAKTLVHSLISSRVDYCNSIFYGATDVVVRRLQSVLNAAARLISNRRKFDHITPVLRDQLHWLPIRQRIVFKIAVFVYNALHGRGPTYLSRTCNPVREVGARAHLRSAIRGDLTVPRTRTRRYGPRSFRVSGPVVWNSAARGPSNSRTVAGTFQI